MVVMVPMMMVVTMAPAVAEMPSGPARLGMRREKQAGRKCEQENGE
jgi:hypothetical protein